MEKISKQYYTAVIVEPRKHKALHFVLRNVLDCLPANDWKILFFHGEDNEDYANEILKSIYLEDDKNKEEERIKLVKLEGVKNLTQLTYSKLLASDTFIYDHIDTEYFLIFQTDSMMFKKNSHLIQGFIDDGYDYVGAPWLICNYLPTKERDFIGNGGFSLRRKDKMLEIISKFKWDENVEWHEDLFFTKKHEGITPIKKPSYEFAKVFCVDEVFSPFAIACHRVWCHSHYSEFAKLYPEVEELRNLQDWEE